MNNYQKYGKKYYEKNKEKFAEYRRKWLENNPKKAQELQKKASQRYYARKKQLENSQPEPLVESSVSDLSPTNPALGSPQENKETVDLNDQEGELPFASAKLKQQVKIEKYNKARDILYSC